MAKVAVCASIITDGMETTSGVSSSVYPLTTMITNYHAPVLTEGSLTRWTEDGQSSGLVLSRIRNAPASRILVLRHYTTCPEDRTYGFFFLGPRLLPTCHSSMHPIHLVGIVTSFLLYISA